jgi:hypothetical protein
MFTPSSLVHGRPRNGEALLLAQSSYKPRKVRDRRQFNVITNWPPSTTKTIRTKNKVVFVLSYTRAS